MPYAYFLSSAYSMYFGRTFLLQEQIDNAKTPFPFILLQFCYSVDPFYVFS